MKFAALALTLSLGLSACLNLEFEPPATVALETQTALRINEATGAIEWLTVDRGVRVRESNGVAHLKAVLGGARIYPIEGGAFVSVNFDTLKGLPEEHADNEELALLMEMEPNISVVGVGLAEEPDGRLTLWRHSQLERAAHWLARAQRVIPKNASLELGQFPTFDAPSLEQLRAARAEGEFEWRIEGRTLVYEIPSTAENARRCEAAILSEVEPESLLFFTLGPPQFSHDGRRFSARYAPGDDGWIRGHSRGAEFAVPTPTVATEELRKAGLAVETSAQLRERLARLGLAD